MSMSFRANIHNYTKYMNNTILMDTELILQYLFYRETMECLITNHTYARSPLGTGNEGEIDDPLKQREAFLAKGQLACKSFVII